jgi:PPOX class probable F420-dependent enzyme
MTSGAQALEPFVRQRTIRLTTYRRDGTPVATPVNIAVDGNRAYIRTYDRAGKAKRLRNNPDVEIAPSTVRGKPTRLAVRAQARLLSGDEAKNAARAIARKHRILQGILVPLAHRLARYKTLHYELTIVDTGEQAL